MRQAYTEAGLHRHFARKLTQTTIDPKILPSTTKLSGLFLRLSLLESRRLMFSRIRWRHGVGGGPQLTRGGSIPLYVTRCHGLLQNVSRPVIADGSQLATEVRNASINSTIA